MPFYNHLNIRTTAPTTNCAFNIPSDEIHAQTLTKLSILSQNDGMKLKSRLKLEDNDNWLLTVVEYKKRKINNIEILIFVFKRTSTCFDANAHVYPVYKKCHLNLW